MHFNLCYGFNRAEIGHDYQSSNYQNLHKLSSYSLKILFSLQGVAQQAYKSKRNLDKFALLPRSIYHYFEFLGISIGW